MPRFEHLHQAGPLVWGDPVRFLPHLDGHLRASRGGCPESSDTAPPAHAQADTPSYDRRRDGRRFPGARRAAQGVTLLGEGPVDDGQAPLCLPRRLRAHPRLGGVASPRRRHLRDGAVWGARRRRAYTASRGNARPNAHSKPPAAPAAPPVHSPEPPRALRPATVRAQFFVVGVDCSRRTFFAGKALNDFVGALVLLPLLRSLDSVRQSPKVRRAAVRSRLDRAAPCVTAGVRREHRRCACGARSPLLTRVRVSRRRHRRRRPVAPRRVATAS